MRDDEVVDPEALLVAVAIGALAAPALAGAAQTPGTRGIVVQRDAKAGVVVIASKSGKLLRIKMAQPGKVAMGTVLRVVGTKVTIVGRDASFERSAQRIADVFGADRIASLRPTSSTLSTPTKVANCRLAYSMTSRCTSTAS